MAASVSQDASTPESTLAKPLHVQSIEKALNIQPVLNYVEDILSQSVLSDVESSTDGDTDIECKEVDSDGNKIYNGVVVSKADRKADKTRVYNFTKVKKSRKWLKNVLLSDSSSEDEEEEAAISHDEYIQMLHMHQQHKKHHTRFYEDKDLLQYQYYSVGLLSNFDKFYQHQKLIVGPKKKLSKEQKKLEKLMKAQIKQMNKEMLADSDGQESIGGPVKTQVKCEGKASLASKKAKKQTPEQLAGRRRRLWVMIAKKEIPRAHKQKASAKKELMTSLRKVAKESQKECRKMALQSQKVTRDAAMRARRLSKENMVYWKRFDKVSRDTRKKAEKVAHEQRKMDMELREMRRQQRKLNFLITQTELYAHFMSRKLTGETDADKDKILGRLDEDTAPKKEAASWEGNVLEDRLGDHYDSNRAKSQALRNAEDAFQAHQKKTSQFDTPGAIRKASEVAAEWDEKSSFANPSMGTAAERSQPMIFDGQLKGYQLKGMNWLANLYDQGISGILADEMGLGKTVQSIALLAHLAEEQGIWGPFLIVAPASTLHNWQQELSRFLPKLKSVPYWGNTQDRKILRKFWNQDNMHTKEASFHIVVTSYQLIIQDVKYFQRIKWHYMILDEAQALKSTASARWKILLGFNCRNRLLLTGTPIQNSMQELWALLHFIMPTLFDSHEEFNEWFSKDIESHAEKQSGIDESQLSRLHMILKPFMLRRIKKDVENELSDKIEILVYCPFTTRQKLLYQAIKNKISIEDLLQSATASTGTNQSQCSTSNLMNLVMQFRKVCNHPDLFERRDMWSPLFFSLQPYSLPKLIFREGLLEQSCPSKQHLLYNKFCIHNPEHVHHSLFPMHTKESSGQVRSEFSFLRFIDQSPAEHAAMMLAGLIIRWLGVFLWLKEAYRIHHHRQWHHQQTHSSRYLQNKDFLLESNQVLSVANVSCSPVLRDLVFTNHNTTHYTHTSHVVHYVPETIHHRKIRLRKLSGKAGGGEHPHHHHHQQHHHKGGGGGGGLAGKKGPGSPTLAPTIMSPTKMHGKLPMSPIKSPSKNPLSPTRKVSQTHQEEELPVFKHTPRASKGLHCVLTAMPSFLYRGVRKVNVPYMNYSCCDRSSAWQQMHESQCGTLEARNTLLYGTMDICEQVRWARMYFHPSQPGGLRAVQPTHGYMGLQTPDKEMLVTDAGKLYVLDTLLDKLKKEGHRVLIYSQMTRMIDVLEEYMYHRKHTYIRLDGSSKISDRRDMVADFQSKSDIFIFLLSTRAGGLGINLTAADTVIFYDSDWNPTVDQQAMDRAHRLGQTKQVTVYRLICQGTIEQRILQRAKEKSEIQRMVISGGQFKPDTLKPKEVVSLLLDDDEMERRLQYKQEETNKRQEYYDQRGRDSRKRKHGPGIKGRGPGRPPKKKKLPDQNVTIPAGGDFDLSMDSASATASPQSVISGAGSEALQMALGVGDDSSNDALVIVDDAYSYFPETHATSTPPPTQKRGARGRGRPKGSGVGRRPRGRGSVQKAISAAEVAGAEAAKKAAFAAYGYSLAGEGRGSTSTAPARGVGVTPPRRGGPATRGGSARRPPATSAAGFYTQNNDNAS